MAFRWFVVRKKRSRTVKRGLARRQYLLHRESARCIIMERLMHWSGNLKAAYNQVAIRDQSTRWGSCSKKGNLNFNYRIAFLPEELMDYIIVHELCHLIEFNHSASFWAEVESRIPDYRRRRAALRTIPIGTLSSDREPVVEVRA